MRGAGFRMVGLVLGLAISTPVFASQPEKLRLFLSVHNLLGPGNEGDLPISFFLGLMEKVNEIWSRCGIQFVPRSYASTHAAVLKVNYEPGSQEDLSRIYDAFHPQGMPEDSIPLMVAGPWKVKTGNFQLYGLGWAFLKPGNRELDRAGAMVAAQRIKESYGAQLISHELGHALTLPHSPDSDNVMAGGYHLTEHQCAQTRGFATTYLGSRVHQLGGPKQEVRLAKDGTSAKIQSSRVN